ncbi:MAG: hypothetical protein HKN48_08635 [Flavobacteriaceae bacterium]|nr:hypothetical protein [Flavobacteriaceae bacterium]
MFRAIYCLAGVLLLLGCSVSSSYKGWQIVEASFEAHGGWETYRNLDTLTLVKTTRLFFEDGSLESEISETQLFIRNPEYKTTLIREGDTLLSSSIDSIVDPRIHAAEFIMFQPFSLNNSEADIEYLGAIEIMNEEEVSEIKITFPESEDIWWFYFDKEKKCVANKVFHNSRYSWIENLAFQNYNDLLLHKHRKSYFLDSLGNNEYLRSEYFYHILE